MLAIITLIEIALIIVNIACKFSVAGLIFSIAWFAAFDALYIYATRQETKID